MNIPEDPSMGYIAILLFLIGLFLFISGLNIIKIEKISVSSGLKTWGIGLALMIAGVLIGVAKNFPFNKQEKNNIHATSKSKVSNENLYSNNPYIDSIKSNLHVISNGEMSKNQLIFFIKNKLHPTGYDPKKRIKKISYGNILENYGLVTKKKTESIDDKNLVIFRTTPHGDKIFLSIMDLLANRLNYNEYANPHISSALNDLSIEGVTLLIEYDRVSEMYSKMNNQELNLANHLKMKKLIRLSLEKDEYNRYKSSITNLGQEANEVIKKLLPELLLE